MFRWSECHTVYATQDDCNRAGGSWQVIPFETASLCELGKSQLTFCDDRDCSPLFSQRNASECGACGGNPAQPASWKAGRWEASQYRVGGEWREAEAVAPFIYAKNSTLSFKTMEERIAEAQAEV